MARKRLRIVVKEFESEADAKANCQRLGKVVLATREDGSTVWTTVVAVYR